MTDVLRYHWRPAKAFRRGRGPYKHPVSIILHSTDGHEAGDLATLTHGGVSAHWYVTRDGRVFHLVQDADTAYHAGRVRDPRFGNAASVGIEQEHVDCRQDWPEAQIEATARIVAFLRQQHGDIVAVGHNAACAPPGRKVDPVAYPWPVFSGLVAEAMKTHWRAEAISEE